MFLTISQLETFASRREVNMIKKCEYVRFNSDFFTFVFCFKNFVILTIGFGIFDLGIFNCSRCLRWTLKIAVSTFLESFLLRSQIKNRVKVFYIMPYTRIVFLRGTQSFSEEAKRQSNHK